MEQEARELYFHSLAYGGLAARIPGFNPSWKKMLIAQSSRLWNPRDCSLPGSSVHRILQARILEWVAIPFSRGSSQPRDWTQVSCLQADTLSSEPPGSDFIQTTQVQFLGRELLITSLFKTTHCYFSKIIFCHFREDVIFRFKSSRSIPSEELQ